MTNNSRLENSFNNAMTGLILRLLTILFSFASRTLFIRILGDGCLGLNSVFTSILSMFSLAELGIGEAITFYMYKPIAANDQKRVASLVNFYRICYRIIGAVIGLIGICLIPFLPSLVNLETDVGYNITLIYLLYLANTVVSYLFFAYPRTVLTAHQQAYAVNIVDAIFSFVSIAGELTVLLLTRNFIAYLLVKLILQITKNAVLGILTRRKFPHIYSSSKARLTKVEIKEMFKDVYGLFILRLSSQLLDSTDNLFISAILGTVLAGHNSNYLMIINAVYGIVNTVIYSSTASVGHLCATEPKPRIEQVYRTMDFVNFWVSCFCTVCLYQLLNPFITLAWGSKYTFSMFAVALMCINFYLVSSLYTLFVFRQGLGLFRYCFYNQLIAAVINLVLDFFLVKSMGIEGLFLATVLANLLGAIFPFARNIYIVGFEMPWKPYLLRMFRQYVICFGCCCITSLLCTPLPVTIPGFIGQVLICISVPNLLIIALFHRSEAFKSVIVYVAALLKKVFHKN